MIKLIELICTNKKCKNQFESWHDSKEESFEKCPVCGKATEETIGKAIHGMHTSSWGSWKIND